MLGSAVRMWLRPAIFFSAFCGSAFICSAASASPRDDGPDSISALPAPTGPDESTPAADYVRKPTDPPPFNPGSSQATAARKREAARRKVAQVPTTDGTTVAGSPRQREGHDLAAPGGTGQAGHPDSLYGHAAVCAGARDAAEQRHDTGGRASDRHALCPAGDGHAVCRAGDRDAVRRAVLRNTGQPAPDGAGGQSVRGVSFGTRVGRGHGGSALCHPDSCPSGLTNTAAPERAAPPDEATPPLGATLPGRDAGPHCGCARWSPGGGAGVAVGGAAGSRWRAAPERGRRRLLRPDERAGSVGAAVDRAAFAACPDESPNTAGYPTAAPPPTSLPPTDMPPAGAGPNQ